MYPAYYLYGPKRLNGRDLRAASLENVLCFKSRKRGDFRVNSLRKPTPTDSNEFFDFFPKGGGYFRSKKLPSVYFWGYFREKCHIISKIRQGVNPSLEKLKNYPNLWVSVFLNGKLN